MFWRTAGGCAPFAPTAKVESFSGEEKSSKKKGASLCLNLLSFSFRGAQVLDNEDLHKSCLVTDITRGTAVFTYHYVILADVFKKMNIFGHRSERI